MTDPLGEALHLLRMSGTFYCRSELTEPWGLTMPTMDDCLWFHVLTSGRCRIEVEGETKELNPGDVLLVPHGAGHGMGSDDETPRPVVVDLPQDFETDSYAILKHGGGGETTQLICGAVQFTDPAARHLVGLLPRIIHVESKHAGQMRGTIDLMALESREVRAGGEAVITRLSDVLVIQAIRAWLDHDPGARVGWLGALKDDQIGQALALIHRDPARPWTVATLAKETAMSRSAFAARFTDLVGEPAMRYVTRWRMQVALDKLREGSTVAELAHRLGYQSEAAFSRAFKRIVGVPPGSAGRGGVLKTAVDWPQMALPRS